MQWVMRCIDADGMFWGKFCVFNFIHLFNYRGMWKEAFTILLAIFKEIHHQIKTFICTSLVVIVPHYLTW